MEVRNVTVAHKGVGDTAKSLKGLAGKRMSLRVLVASADMELQKNVSETLIADGCRVTKAQNGFEALYVAQLSEPFDIILLDTEVSKQDAIDATVQLRSLFGRKGCAPIVALVDAPCPSEYAYFLDAGFDEVMPKPVIPSNLMQRCKRAIMQRLSADEGVSSEGVVSSWGLRSMGRLGVA